MAFDKRKLTDPLTQQVYTLRDDGFIEVYDPNTDQRGIFDENANWQSGELRYANRSLAGWIGRVKP